MAKTRSNHTNGKYDRGPCFVCGQRTRKRLRESSVWGLWGGLWTLPADFSVQVTAWQPLLCWVLWSSALRISTQVSGCHFRFSTLHPTPHLLPGKPAPGSHQRRRRWFPSHLRWNLGSLPLLASSTPVSLTSWRCVLRAHLAHLSLLPVPWLPWLSLGLNHLLLKFLEGCHSWFPLPKLPSHSVHLTHHCQIHSAKILLKNVKFTF